MYFCVMVSVKAQVVSKKSIIQNWFDCQRKHISTFCLWYVPADLQLAGCLIPDSMVYFVTSVDSQST